MKDNGAVNYSSRQVARGRRVHYSGSQDVLAAMGKKQAAAAAASCAERTWARAQTAARVTADELRAAQSIIKDKFFDKYSGFQAAFRSVDEMAGYINRAELEQCLVSLNLNIRKEAVDTLIDFIDCEKNLMTQMAVQPTSGPEFSCLCHERHHDDAAAGDPQKSYTADAPAGECCAKQCGGRDQH